MITEEYFTEAVGRPPENDDMERVNCSDAGEIGHSACGWCYCLNQPVFQGKCQKLDNGGECLGLSTPRQWSEGIGPHTRVREYRHG